MKPYVAYIVKCGIYFKNIHQICKGMAPPHAVVISVVNSSFQKLLFYLFLCYAVNDDKGGWSKNPWRMLSFNTIPRDTITSFFFKVFLRERWRNRVHVTLQTLAKEVMWILLSRLHFKNLLFFCEFAQHQKLTETNITKFLVLAVTSHRSVRRFLIRYFRVS